MGRPDPDHRHACSIKVPLAAAEKTVVDLDPSGDDFFRGLGRAPTPVAAASPARGLPAYRMAAALALLVLATALWFWWSNRAEPLPESAPPPGGGTLQVPPTVGGLPLSPRGVDSTWVSRTLSSYDPEDVLFQYYIGPESGLVSVVALRGPVQDLPDRANATGDPAEWEVIGDTQCGPLYVKVATDPEGIKGDGHVCWRSSGDFSVSVLTTSMDAGTTADLVDEVWSTQ